MAIEILDNNMQFRCPACGGNYELPELKKPWRALQFHLWGPVHNMDLPLAYSLAHSLNDGKIGPNEFILEVRSYHESREALRQDHET